MLLAGIMCGVLSGAGIAFVLKASATTGGTDMLASIVKGHFPHFPMATLILAIDAVIIAAGLFLFGRVKNALCDYFCVRCFQSAQQFAQRPPRCQSGIHFFQKSGGNLAGSV